MIEIVFSHDTHPQGIVFRMGGTKGTTRFSPYVWLNFCDYEIAGRTLKLDFSRYDVVLWAAENHSLEKLFGFTPCSQFATAMDCLLMLLFRCSPTPMFHPQGPTLRELAVQALSSTERGYDLLAPKFDYTPFRTPEEILGPALAHLAEPHSITAALDVCCGTGAALRHLRPLCRDRVVGIDFSRGMLAIARRVTADAPGEAPIDLVCGNVLHMPFNAAFDVAVCFGALGHILPQEQAQFVAQVVKALKPGGRFVCVTTPRPALWSARYWYARGFNGVMHLRNRLLSPSFMMYYLTFPLPELVALLDKHGFSVDVHHGVFAGRFRHVRLVIGTLAQRHAA